MFDANMRYIKKGKKFFAEILAIDETGKLYNLGLRQGDAVMCHMLNEGNINPMVDMLINGRRVVVASDQGDFDWIEWIVYAGNADGKTDFICDKVKAKANHILNNS